MKTRLLAKIHGNIGKGENIGKDQGLGQQKTVKKSRNGDRELEIEIYTRIV